jgi:periplasmic divalent cation tolerance protein
MAEPAVTDRAVVVLVTWPTSQDPAAFARALVHERLAACVNVLPEVQSFYRWQGELQQDPERQLLVKTTADRLAALEARVGELHPYEVPEFLVVKVEGGSASYLDWLVASTRPLTAGRGDA